MTVTKTVLMDADAIQRSVKRISHEILERNQGAERLCLVGICSRGVPLAHRIAESIRAIEGVEIPVGCLDVTLYRDDLDERIDLSHANGTDIRFSVAGARIVLVDDVIYTGRTARAAMDGIMKLGRADRIMLAVLIDRGHRELPIKADFVGKNVPTSRHESVSVILGETDSGDRVELQEKT